jgi:hypothetical protein
MEVTQVNLNHCEMAQDLLFHQLIVSRCDLALIAEPYRVPKEDGKWVQDKTGTAAIYACGKYPIQEVISVDKEGFVVAVINGVYVCSCYAPPRWSQEAFEDMLDLMTGTLIGKKPVVLGGDLNAWAEEWGSRLTNPRGQCTLEALASLDVRIVNVGSTNTFSRNGRESVIDVTFCSPSLVEGMNWRISDTYTGSDHSALRYVVRNGVATTLVRKKCRKTQWKVRYLDRGVLRDTFGWLMADTERITASHLTNVMTNACDMAMPRKGEPKSYRQKAYWWSDEIASLRADCFKARRLAQRARSEVLRNERLTLYKTRRAQLKRAIEVSNYAKRLMRIHGVMGIASLWRRLGGHRYQERHARRSSR